MKAQEQGLARVQHSYDEVLQGAYKIIGRSRELTQLMMKQGFIPEAPND
jgi:malate dehydrogenase (oxaloacetate-decarboxylating)